MSAQLDPESASTGIKALSTRVIGPFFVIAFYGLVYMHIVSFFQVTLVVLSKKAGPQIGLIWVALGLCIVYNILFNHSLAVFVKSSGP